MDRMKSDALTSVVSGNVMTGCVSVKKTDAMDCLDVMMEVIETTVVYEYSIITVLFNS